jgi:hypothetical protein
MAILQFICQKIISRQIGISGDKKLMRSKILFFLTLLFFTASLLPCEGESTQNLAKTGNASLAFHSSPPLQNTAGTSSPDRILPANEAGSSLPGTVSEAEGLLPEKSSRSGKVSESAILLFLGFGLITIAGFGRRKLP